MKKSRAFLRTVIVSAAAIFSFAPELWARPFTIGSMAANSEREMKEMLPLARYLGENLKAAGFSEVKVIVTKSPQETIQALLGGKLDLYIDNAYLSIALREASGSVIALRRWKRGVSDYASLIFARKDGAVRRLADLRGKIIGFGRASPPDYLLPKLFLQKQGFKLEQVKGLEESVRPDTVGYVLTGDSENTMEWVLMGKTAAGAISDQNLRREARGRVGELAIVEKTFTLPRHLISFRGALDPELRRRVTTVLLEMDRSAEGRKALDESGNTTKFDQPPPEVIASLHADREFIKREYGIR